MLEEKLARFTELERSMTDPEVLTDSHRLSKIAREHGMLARFRTAICKNRLTMS